MSDSAEGLVRAVGIGIITLLIIGALRRIGRPAVARRTRSAPRSVPSEEWAPLPSVDAVVDGIDVQAARARLLGTASDDGIIQCWIQVQHDLANVGFRPDGSETASEYVERVEGGTIDRLGPIADLAALYSEARFSDHDMTSAQLAQALAALEQIAALATAGSLAHRNVQGHR